MTTEGGGWTLTDHIGSTGCIAKTGACSNPMAVLGNNAENLAAGFFGALSCSLSSYVFSTLNSGSQWASLSREQQKAIWNLPRDGRSLQSILRADVAVSYPLSSVLLYFRFNHLLLQ
jgi:hypothetical protein